MPKSSIFSQKDRYIAFGIPSLDSLMGTASSNGESANTNRARYGYALSEMKETGAETKCTAESATFCIIGPDGTGKSLFALHLASDYWRRTHDLHPSVRIIYASTDLSYERAEGVWRSFWLDRPWSRYRRLPFESDWIRPNDDKAGRLELWEQAEKKKGLRLQRCNPTESSHPTSSAKDIAEYLVDGSGPAHIAFLDLESTTSGDDWALLHKLLAILERPKDDQAPRHLLIIDAVEGLETLVGNRDSFGELQSRRARIAQLVRAASDKCHLAFVVEEPKDGERLPEVFVADTVVRLRSITDRDYARRTVELEKVRGQRHIRGQHDVRIRQECSTTGDDANPDDPKVGAPGDPEAKLSEESMAYIQVFPSLHYLTRDLPQSAARLDDLWKEYKWRYAAFGIYQLDSMLWQAPGPEYRDMKSGAGDFEMDDPETQKLLQFYDANGVNRGAPPCLREKSVIDLEHTWRELRSAVPDSLPKPIAGFDPMGVPAGSITTLIGNDSTYKSQLARSFLSQCFRTRHRLHETPTHLPVVAENSWDPLLGQGVGILLATYDTDRSRLAELLHHHLIRDPAGRAGPALPKGPSQHAGLRHRLIVRRLEPHHFPSALLVHVVEQLVKEAKRRLLEAMQPGPLGQELQRLHGRIRLVIDDWSTILAMYPEVQRDPLVLPYLMNYLRREGVTALILATRSGNPQDRGTGELEQDIRELRVMADHHLYTWHVSFFDERRVAITMQPSPVRGSGLQVRELRPGRRSELPDDRMSVPEKPVAKTPRANEQSVRALKDKDEQFDDQALVVDPHFELYAGLQDGKPTPVPLEVRLFAEHEEVAPFKAYLGEIRYLFRHLFGHDEHRTVLQPQYGQSYEQLRELSYLQSEARLDHTLVIQVDEFWAESRSELRRQERYLHARTVERDGTPLKAEDPFGLFQSTDALDDRREAGGRERAGPMQRQECFDLIGYDLEQATKWYPIDKVPYAWDFGFLICNGIAWDRAKDEQDHRTCVVVRDGKKDEGYRLKEQNIWKIWNRLWKIGPCEYAMHPELLQSIPPVDPTPIGHWTQHLTKELDKDGTKHTVMRTIDFVGDPDRNSRQAGSNSYSPSPDQIQKRPVSWREFLGACKTIAGATRYEFLPFDVDLLATESFSCLVLEVWFSELYQACNHPKTRSNPVGMKVKHDLQSANRWPRKRRQDPYSASLTELLDNSDKGLLYRRALYRAMLLLDEVFGQKQLADDNLMLESRSASPKAVASRHWYSTATMAMPGGPPSRGQILVGLPGHYAARGDWFLAVAKGSRSPRLGERAMDILCSRRANIMRLQRGLGLPVRDLVDRNTASDSPEARLEYWTSLPYVSDNNVQQPISYEELRKLGAFDGSDGLGRAKNFHWLWRSTIGQYDVHSRIWQRWLIHLFKGWRTWKTPSATDLGGPNRVVVDTHQRGKPWWDGFCEYDHYEKCYFRDPVNKICYVEPQYNPRWEEFNACCDGLIETLGRASKSLNAKE